MRKKPTDYKLRAFVALMFLAIIFFVSFAYVLYHQQALTKAYFDKVQFNEPKRLIRILNNDDSAIFKASLGKFLNIFIILLTMKKIMEAKIYTDIFTFLYRRNKSDDLCWPI